MKRTLLFLIAMVAMVTTAPLMAKGVNMKKYITLTVKSGEDIGLDFKATQANTPVRIVSGGNTQNIIVNNTWYAGDNQYFTVTADGTTMTIYGDIVDFNCSLNLENLTSLDVSKNPQLAYLDCSYNELTSLDVSKNPQLTELYCHSNQLTSLDVSKNPQLTYLYCSSNQLTSLDVSKNPKLTTLSCVNNQLTSLDVSKNPQLTYLYCYDNPFSTNAVNMIYCSLPDRTDKYSPGVCYIIKDTIDPSPNSAQSATSDIAKKKNWKVRYSDGTEVPSKGNYKCK